MEPISHLLQTLAVLSVIASAQPVEQRQPDCWITCTIQDEAHGCTYVIAKLPDGVHIFANGGPHCPGLIKIDGKGIAPDKRAAQ